MASISSASQTASPTQSVEAIRDSIVEMAGGRIRKLQVSQSGKSVLIQGTTTLYYHKQLATRAAERHLENSTVSNMIEVQSEFVHGL